MRPWSYSRLSTYLGCPQSYKWAYVEKLPGFREEAPAASRGKMVHQAAEDYLKGYNAAGTVMMYPKELQKVAGHAMMLKGKRAMPELKYAATFQWEACDYEAPEAYFRGILDITYEDNDGLEVHIQDWKTGQVYPDHPVQLERYVVVAAPSYPKAEKFITRLIYIDQGVVSAPRTILRERLKPMRLLLDAQIKQAEEDTIYPATPSKEACRWCEYHAKHGGPCTVGK